MNEEYIESPCNSICIFDSDKDMCVGCFRTLDEISSWKYMSNREKLKVIERIEKQQKEEENN